jgi:hypothetical protein
MQCKVCGTKWEASLDSPYDRWGARSYCPDDGYHYTFDPDKWQISKLTGRYIQWPKRTNAKRQTKGVAR